MTPARQRLGKHVPKVTQQQKKTRKPEWSTVRRRFTKQHTRYSLNCWRHIHDRLVKARLSRTREVETL
jgi:hypothetical protein